MELFTAGPPEWVDAGTSTGIPAQASDGMTWSVRVNRLRSVSQLAVLQLMWLTGGGRRRGETADGAPPSVAAMGNAASLII
jgi:hypothetical protein